MDLFSVIFLLTLTAAAVAALKVRKRKEYRYSLLDISGMILNAVFGVMVYPPLCLSAMLLASERAGLSTVMARLMGTVCVAGVAASVLLRRKEKPGPSFLVQFAGFGFYGLLVLVALCGF